MLDHAPRLTWVTPPALPVDRLVLGRSIEEASAILPRVFNLCRGAQETAARLAFGKPLVEGADDALHAEILRDHVMMLAIRLPRHFGGVAQALPSGWQSDPALLRPILLGDLYRMPDEAFALALALTAREGVFRLLAQVRDSFLPGEAASDVLPVPEGAEALEIRPFENSVAGRWADLPMMRAVERNYGRGPFWRVLGRVVELEALMSGYRLGFRATPAGEAFVAAARGTYAVRAKTDRGVVKAFHRVTPTDHLLAPGGVMEQSLARLPDQKRGLGPLLLDILDPCVPLKLQEVQDA